MDYFVKEDQHFNPLGPVSIVYTFRHLQAWGMPQFYTRNLVVVMVEGLKSNRTKKALVFSSIYMSHDKPAPPPAMERVVNHCEINNVPLIIGCGANAHTVHGVAQT